MWQRHHLAMNIQSIFSNYEVYEGQTENCYGLEGKTKICHDYEGSIEIFAITRFFNV